MQKKYTVNIIFLLALLFCLPTGIHAEESYSTITASVPVSFFAPSKGTNNCVAVMETINDSPEPILDIIEFTGSGTEEFDIDINEPGTYRYTVYQQPGTDGEIDYDDTVYSVIVFVTSDTEKSLKYAVTATASDTGRKPDTIEFKNTAYSDDNSSGPGSNDSRGRSDTEDGSGKSSPLNKDGETPSKTDTDITKETDPGNDPVNDPETDENNNDTNNNNNTDNNNSNNTNNNTDIPDGPAPETDDEGMASKDRQMGDAGGITDIRNSADPNTFKTDSDITTETAVKTGDSSRQELWLALMCASLAVIVMSFVIERTEKKNYYAKEAGR